MSDSRRDNPQTERDAVRDAVRDGYARIAREAASARPGALPLAEPRPAGRSSCCGPASCCGASAPGEAAGLAARVGYEASDLAALPDGANLGLSCGNPVALASLRPGEVVLDLGSGAGFDAFIAGPRVGPSGRVIGVDMTPEMLAQARRHLPAYRERSGLDNVEFRLGEIEHLPVADGCIDVVISNCVLNLSPDKPQVWREIARVMRPGGRVAVSDLALLRPLPAAVRASVEALVGCVAGAVLVEETARMAREAGLADVRLETRLEYVAAMDEWQDPLYREIAASLPAGTTVADFVTSLAVSAVKPGR